MIVERVYEYKGVKCTNGIDPIEFCRLVQFDIDKKHKLYGLKHTTIIFDEELDFLNDVYVASFEYQDKWHIVFKFDRATDIRFYNSVETVIAKDKDRYNEKSLAYIYQNLALRKKPYVLEVTSEMIDVYMKKVLDKYA